MKKLKTKKKVAKKPVKKVATKKVIIKKKVAVKKVAVKKEVVVKKKKKKIPPFVQVDMKTGLAVDGTNFPIPVTFHHYYRGT